jgi:hypothetical protein
MERSNLGYHATTSYEGSATAVMAQKQELARPDRLWCLSDEGRPSKNGYVVHID